MKKITIILSFILILAIGNIAYAENNLKISLSTDKKEIKVGDTVTIRVYVDLIDSKKISKNVIIKDVFPKELAPIDWILPGVIGGDPSDDEHSFTTYPIDIGQRYEELGLIDSQELIIKAKAVKKGDVVVKVSIKSDGEYINDKINIKINNEEKLKRDNKIVRLIINDKEIKSDVTPILKDSRTLAPLRVVSENLGYKVKWNQETWTATLTKDKQIIEVTRGSNIIKVNNDGKLSEVKIDVPAEIINSRTMLPLRAIAEISGAKVEWDNINWQVLINTK